MAKKEPFPLLLINRISVHQQTSLIKFLAQELQAVSVCRVMPQSSLFKHIVGGLMKPQIDPFFVPPNPQKMKLTTIYMFADKSVCIPSTQSIFCMHSIPFLKLQWLIQMPLSPHNSNMMSLFWSVYGPLRTCISMSDKRSRALICNFENTLNKQYG